MWKGLGAPVSGKLQPELNRRRGEYREAGGPLNWQHIHADLVEDLNQDRVSPQRPSWAPEGEWETHRFRQTEQDEAPRSQQTVVGWAGAAPWRPSRTSLCT